MMENADARTSPLGDEEFADLMAPLGPFEAQPLLAVAVSGGADSMALCLLADKWVRMHGGALVALTVDHGLRPGAAEEARMVGERLGGRGIAHRVFLNQASRGRFAVDPPPGGAVGGCGGRLGLRSRPWYLSVPGSRGYGTVWYRRNGIVR